MKLKRIIEQADVSAQYYDLGKDFSAFQRSMDMSTEQVKGKFEQAIGSKLNGKKIRARASRGYKQFEKDYEINVTVVSLDDYYDNYVVVAKATNGKEYFLKPGFKVQVLSSAEEQAPEQPAQQPTPQSAQAQSPVQPQPPPQAANQQPPPTSVPQLPQPPQPDPEEEDPKKPVKEWDSPRGDTEVVNKYTFPEILDDVKKWLPQLLDNRRADLKHYIPQEGIKRTVNRRTGAVYGVVIPTEDSFGLTMDMVKRALSDASKRTGDIETIYILQKFDVRGGKYVIIVKKLFNY